MSIRLTRSRVIFLTAFAAVVTGGVAYASIPASNGTIQGCYRTAGGDNEGQLRIVEDASNCRSNETSLQFNQQGIAGPAGPTGAKGDRGDAGAAWLPSYGIAQVLVSRGGKPASVWATYSTTLGSPVGDNTSGTFRFTCATDKAPCDVSAQAYTSSTGTVRVYPRILIYKSSFDTGQVFGQCEYGDGIDNNGGLATLTNSAAPITLGIGGSLDCGSAQAYPANGVATDIQVPAGYYDVFSTFVFVKS